MVNLNTEQIITLSATCFIKTKPGRIYIHSSNVRTSLRKSYMSLHVHFIRFIWSTYNWLISSSSTSSPKVCRTQAFLTSLYAHLRHFTPIYVTLRLFTSRYASLRIQVHRASNWPQAVNSCNLPVVQSVLWRHFWSHITAVSDQLYTMLYGDINCPIQQL